MKSTREKWFGKKYDFYLIGHVHLYVFRKPDSDERTAKFRENEMLVRFKYSKHIIISD